MKLLGNREVLRWFRGDLIFRDPLVETAWGVRHLKAFYPDHKIQKTWSGAFGEFAFKEYCNFNKINVQAARQMSGKNPDFETYDTVFEIKTKMHSSKHSRMPSILKTIEKYKNLPKKYKKPIVFVFMGGLEYEELPIIPYDNMYCIHFSEILFGTIK